MSADVSHVKVGYFGKIPSHGDFVKATDNVALITVLDNWLAQSMDLLATDPRWKLIYDGLKPLHFVFLGPRSRRAIAGHLIPSADQAQRRFPFLSMSAFDVDDPYAFVKKSPLILSRLWTRLESMSTAVVAPGDATALLQRLASTSIELELNTTGYDAAFADFINRQTIGNLDQILAHAGFRGTVRQLLLALGLLLQPVLNSHSNRLEKSLLLPIPTDPLYQSLIATFWMHLIAPFLRRSDFELSLFFTQLHDKPCMILGFSGASARTLHAIMHTQIAAEHHIGFEEAGWVEEQLEDDYGIKKLSSYLLQTGLTLKSAYDEFQEAFIGA